MSFVLGERFAEGATSYVYSGTRGIGGERIAIKVLKNELASSMVQNEILLATNLAKESNLPSSVVKFIDVERINKTYAIGMELLSGGDLFTRIANLNSQNVKMSEREVARHIKSAAIALAALHARGILSRDCKLENLVIRQAIGSVPDDQLDAVLVDFGLACKPSVEQGEPLQCYDCQLYGTRGYFAPETLSEGTYSPKTDSWALGVCAYILLCGFMPYEPCKDGECANSCRTCRKQARVKKGVYYPLDRAECLHTSLQARDFIAKIFVVDPAKRMGAEEFLTHPWIVENTREVAIVEEEEQQYMDATAVENDHLDLSLESDGPSKIRVPVEEEVASPTSAFGAVIEAEESSINEMVVSTPPKSGQALQDCFAPHAQQQVKKRRSLFEFLQLLSESGFGQQLSQLCAQAGTLQFEGAYSHTSPPTSSSSSFFSSSSLAAVRMEEEQEQGVVFIFNDAAAMNPKLKALLDDATFTELELMRKLIFNHQQQQQQQQQQQLGPLLQHHHHQKMQQQQSDQQLVLSKEESSFQRFANVTMRVLSAQVRANEKKRVTATRDAKRTCSR